MSFYATGALPWTVTAADEARFRRILRASLLVGLAFAVTLPWLPTPKNDRRTPEIPARLATLMIEREPPAPVPQPLEAAPPSPTEAKPEQRVDATKRVEGARQKAARAGLLALKQDLAALRESAAAIPLDADEAAPAAAAGTAPSATANEAARDLIRADAARGSGGINVAKPSANVGNVALAGRATTQVTSPVANAGTGGTLQRGPGGKSGRSLEEIRLVFERYKGAIYALYHRALRDDATLQGKVVVKLTIASSGKVLDCQIVSSELRAPEFESKLVARLKQFDFGAKDVDAVIITYPIDFLPS